MAKQILDELGHMRTTQYKLDVAELMRTAFAEIPTALYTPKCPVPNYFSAAPQR